MKWVVDASVVVKWFIPEIYEAEAVSLKDGRHDLHAPELMLPDFSSIIRKKIRRGEIQESEGETIVEALSSLEFTYHSHQGTIKSAYLGAQATGQTVYDWTYLALAISLDCGFVTADRKFYNSLRGTPFVDSITWIADV